MDAYDIFKKISQGVKFSRQFTQSKVSLPKNSSVPKQEDSNNLKIKEKKLKTNYEISLFTGKNPKKLLEKPINNVHKQKQLQKEEINHYRNLNRISVVGQRIPDPIKTFDSLEIEEYLTENLKKCNYNEPTPIQKQAIPVMLAGRHLLACAPTGSGKTVAFLLPIINDLKRPRKCGFRALILCPTRELAKQTQRECVRLSEGRGFHVHVINKIKKALVQYGPKSNQKFDILVTTPNRLCFLLKQDPPALSLASVEWLVIDEADKLFESGNRSFRQQLNEIMSACTNEMKKIAMFSATYTPIVAKWCVHNMKKLIRVTIGHRNAASDTVDQQLLFVGNEQGKLLAFRDLVKNGLKPPVLVFVQSKDRAQQLFNELINDGLNVDAIHADRTQLQRDNTVRSFREGKVWILICTELMARGIDFKGVNLIINYDFPPSSLSYIHRIGRAGRAGRQGKAITFFTIEDTVNLKNIAQIIKESGGEVPEYMLKMKTKSKRERKKLGKNVVKRDDIRIKSVYELRKENKKKTEENNGIIKENRKRKLSDKDSGNVKKTKVDNIATKIKNNVNIRSKNVKVKINK